MTDNKNTKQDLFDPDSVYCFWKRFRISVCIRDARRFMWLWSKSQTVSKSREVPLNVRFLNIDKVVSGRCERAYFDDAWSEISDFCASQNYKSFLAYKEEVRIYNASKRNGKRKKDDCTNDGNSEIFDCGRSENGEEMQVPTFQPYPVMFRV